MSDRKSTSCIIICKSFHTDCHGKSVLVQMQNGNELSMVSKGRPTLVYIDFLHPSTCKKSLLLYHLINSFLAPGSRIS